MVYIQAKRNDPTNVVGRPVLQAFVGSLAGKQAAKGVFVTTSSFSKGGLDYLQNIPQKIVTIDGVKLVELMIEHDVGVRISHSFLIEAVDEDFFNE